MKLLELKKIIKEVVKEAIQDELKEIILEAIMTSKGTYNFKSQTEQINPFTNSTPPIDVRQQYTQILNETSPITSQYAQTFTPSPRTDTINGSLPAGNVGLDQISNLLKGK